MVLALQERRRDGGCLELLQVWEAIVGHANSAQLPFPKKFLVICMKARNQMICNLKQVYYCSECVSLNLSFITHKSMNLFSVLIRLYDTDLTGTTRITHLSIMPQISSKTITSISLVKYCILPIFRGREIFAVLTFR